MLYAMESFGDYIHKLRKRSGLTLKQVEEKGVASNAYLSQLERGLRKRPHPDILKKMADLYEEPVKNLLIEAGYLPAETSREPSREEIQNAFNKVNRDPEFSHGTRLRGANLNLNAKRYVVEMYEKMTGRKLL
jgi:transcriptional regulator with XRE-family HTH domain